MAASAEVAEKTVAILNLSQRGKRFTVLGLDGKPMDILPGTKAVEVPAAQAEHLLGTLPGGRPRYPELQDASKVVPASNLKAERDALLADNKKLLDENADLKKKLADVVGVKEKKK